jgi:peptidase E
MKIILASSFNNNEKDENGVRYPVAMPKSFVSNIKKHIYKFDNVVVVANDPNSFMITEMYANLIFDSLELSKLLFKNKIILDNRNKTKAKQIIETADLIFLCGGEIVCQLEFFKEIGLKKLLKNSNALCIGGSAGAMNLCDTVFNFPETQEEVDNRKDCEYFLNGLGFFDKIIIPHFEYGETNKYSKSDLDVFNEYILPLSKGREFLAYGDDSYIILDNNKVNYIGKFYKIKDGTITEML